jgi:HSP20 family protein
VAFVRHDPFRSVLAGVLRPYGGSPARAPGQPGRDVAAIPARLDVVDKGDRFALTVDLPGVSKDDINVAVEGARVSVTGTARGAENGAASDPVKVLRAERRARNYARTVELPAEVDGDAAEARFENGVLSLTLPKRVLARQITVR